MPVRSPDQFYAGDGSHYNTAELLFEQPPDSKAFITWQVGQLFAVLLLERWCLGTSSSHGSASYSLQYHLAGGVHGDTGSPSRRAPLKSIFRGPLVPCWSPTVIDGPLCQSPHPLKAFAISTISRVHIVRITVVVMDVHLRYADLANAQ